MCSVVICQHRLIIVHSLTFVYLAGAPSLKKSAKFACRFSAALDGYGAGSHVAAIDLTRLVALEDYGGCVNECQRRQQDRVSVEGISDANGTMSGSQKLKLRV